MQRTPLTFLGGKAYDENPCDAASNPSGVIQMGLAEKQVSQFFLHPTTKLACLNFLYLTF